MVSSASSRSPSPRRWHSNHNWQDHQSAHSPGSPPCGPPKDGNRQEYIDDRQRGGGEYVRRRDSPTQFAGAAVNGRRWVDEQRAWAATRRRQKQAIRPARPRNGPPRLHVTPPATQPIVIPHHKLVAAIAVEVNREVTNGRIIHRGDRFGWNDTPRTLAALRIQDLDATFTMMVVRSHADGVFPVAV
jgi:hypothetical protein